MGIITKEVEVKPNGKMIRYYRDLGYDAKCGVPLIVKINDLQKGSKTKVRVLCDICKENVMDVAYGNYNQVIEKSGSYACRSCIGEKTKQIFQRKYGVSNVAKLESTKKKARKTNIERYGAYTYSKTKEFHDKYKQTCLDKYGVEHASQAQMVKDKTLKTNLKRYGVKSASILPEIKEKTEKTNLQKYGVLYPSQTLEVRQKVSESFYKNNSQKSSKQQTYLCELYNGELNYPIKYYITDVCIPEEDLSIEYDGGGHDLNVKTGRLTQQEFNQKEIVRFNVIKREGYKQIRIISSKDFLPSDQILLQMLETAREYFSTTSHSWITYDIDNSIMINAENKDTDGVFFDYGELRKIKESA